MRGRGREGGKRKPVVSASQIYIDTMWVNRYMDTVWLKRYCVDTDMQCGYRDTVWVQSFIAGTVSAFLTAGCEGDTPVHLNTSIYKHTHTPEQRHGISHTLFTDRSF